MYGGEDTQHVSTFKVLPHLPAFCVWLMLFFVGNWVEDVAGEKNFKIWFVSVIGISGESQVRL